MGILDAPVRPATILQARNGFSAAKARVEAGLSADILVWSDSTGNGSSGPREWPYLLADALFAQYPTHTVTISLGDGSSWAAATTIGTGSGSATIKIWNFAVSGASAMYGMGAFFDRMLRAVSPHCMILNHGHNHVVGTTIQQVRGELLCAIESFRLYHPECPVVAVKQNPRQDDTTMNTAMTAWDDIASLRDVSLVNVHDAFVALGKPLSLYAEGDTIHPSQSGQDLWHSLMWAHWTRSAAVTAPPTPSVFSVALPTRQNMLVNGGFDKWTTNPGAPDSWTAGGTGSLTPEKETTIVAREELAYSCKLLGITNQTYITQTIDSVLRGKMAGQVVTLAGLRYVSSSAASTVGRIEVRVAGTAGGTVTYTTRSYVTQQTGWVWWCLSGVPVPDDVTSIIVRAYHDTATSTPSVQPAYIDQLVLVPGYLPRRCR